MILLILGLNALLPAELTMKLRSTRLLDLPTIARIVAIVVALTLFIGGDWADAQEFTRSTIPLKSGGSMTSIQSQGKSVAYLNQSTGLRTADARNNAFRNSGQRRETGFNPAFAQGSDSFYRQAAQSNSNGAGSANRDTYPYPQSANSRDRGGFGSTATSGSSSRNDADGGQANLRFERLGDGDRPSGALGETSPGNSGDNNFDRRPLASAASISRVAQLPQPPTQLPTQPPTRLPTQLPPGPSNAGLPPINPAACNCGPNYANPAANYAVGYQGFQPGAQAASSVPSLNIQNPLANSGFNPNCCPPQGAAGFGGYQGYQFQQGIGTPQFGQQANNNPWWSSFLTGSGQYTPLIQFRNMPPGTYLGQGLIGQPTAYVDGQPVRNLLRYVSP